jgi:hypothetical protein
MGAVQGLQPALKEQGYLLEKYSDSTGIYYENKGQLNLYNTEWQVVVYTDLKGIDSQSYEIAQYIKHINKLCQDIAVQNWTDCHHFPELSREKLQQIKRTENLILDVAEHKVRNTRRRRGVFNFIGEISKVLFGTLDNEDAMYYNEQIKHVEENSDDLTKLLKQQLVIVRSTLGTINSTLIDMEYNQEKVKNGLVQIKNLLELVRADNHRKINTLAAKIMVESHIARAREAIDALQRYLDIVIEGIMHARQGILSPQIASPTLIMDSLIRSMPSFPKDVIPPFPLSKDSINLVYKICGIHVYINEGILGYVITLPLIGRGVFQVYRMIPMPISLGRKQFAYIETGEANLCIDQTRQYYFEISNEELKDCKIIDFQSRICKQDRPLLSSHLQETCVVKLLQPMRGIPNNCDTRLVQIKKTIWTQLDNNAWIYFAPSEESVTILCTDNAPVNVAVTGIGKLILNIGCKGYTSFALLQTNVKVKSKGIKGEDLLSRIPIDIDCLEEIGLHSNLSIENIKLDFRHVVSHIDDLKHASYKISELEEEVKEQEWRNHQKVKHSTYSTMVYILFSVIGMYMLYKLYKLYRYLRDRFSRRPKAITATCGEVLPLARTEGLGNTVNINIKTSNESLSVEQGDIPLHSSHHSIEEDSRPRRSLRPRTTKSYF